MRFTKKAPRFGTSKLGFDQDGNESDEQEKIKIKSVSAGAHHSLILTENGQLYSFGYGQHGQLGLRNNTNHCTPQLVKDFLTQPLA